MNSGLEAKRIKIESSDSISTAKMNKPIDITEDDMNYINEEVYLKTEPHDDTEMPVAEVSYEMNYDDSKSGMDEPSFNTMMSKTMYEKRIRSSNFTVEEKYKLVQLVRKYNVILSKKTDYSITKQKEASWLKLQANFNATNYTERSLSSLKKVWNKMKTDAKQYKLNQKNDYNLNTPGVINKLKMDPILEELLLLIYQVRGMPFGSVEPQSDFAESTNSDTPTCAIPPSTSPIQSPPHFVEFVSMKIPTTTVNTSPPQIPTPSSKIPATFPPVTLSTSTSTVAASPIPSTTITTPSTTIITPSLSVPATESPAVSRRRPIPSKFSGTYQDDLIKAKIVTEKLKQQLIQKELESLKERREHEEELFSLKKAKLMQYKEMRQIIMEKLKNGQDVDSKVLEFIYRDS